MPSFQKLLIPLFLTSASSLDVRGQPIQQAAAARELLDASTLAFLQTCLPAAATFGSTSTDTTDATGGFALAQDGVLYSTLDKILGSDLKTVCPEPSACDLANTTVYEQAAGLCTTVGGQLVDTNIDTCKDTLVDLAGSLGTTEADLGLDGVTEVSVSNIPICLPPPPICAKDIDIFRALASAVDAIGTLIQIPADQAAILQIVPKLIEKNDCPAATSGGSALYSLFVAGVLVMGASLFVTL